MQQTGAFYGHEFGADFDSLNVIFNDSGAQQTETLELLDNKRRRANNQWQRHAACGLSTDATNGRLTTVYFKNDVNYVNPRIHIFDLVPSNPDLNWLCLANQ